MLVQDLVVFDVGAQRQRGGGLAAVEEDRGARHPVQRRLHGVELVDERLERPLVVLALAGDEFPAPLPGGQDGEHRDGDEQRKPGPVHELGQVGGEEQQVDREQSAGTGATIHNGLRHWYRTM